MLLHHAIIKQRGESLSFSRPQITDRPLACCTCLELAELVQDSLDHAQRLVVLGTPPPDLVNPQAHEKGVDAQQQLIQVNVLQDRARQASPRVTKLAPEIDNATQ